jgi:hypothetical protein
MQMPDLLVEPLAAAIPGVPAPRSLPEEEEPSTTASGSPRSRLDRNDLATQRGQTKPEMAGRIQVGPLYCGLPIAGPAGPPPREPARDRTRAIPCTVRAPG